MKKLVFTFAFLAIGSYSFANTNVDKQTHISQHN